MKVRMGEGELELGSSLGTLREANDILDDTEAMRDRLAEDGYLLIRDLLPRELVKRARARIVEALVDAELVAKDAEPDTAVIAADVHGAFWGGKKELTHHLDVLDVLEHPDLCAFFARLLGGAVRTYDYKWLRAVAPGEFTGAHYDVVYMGRGTPNLHTCWIPMSDIDYESSPLAVCVGSHRFDKVRETYGTMDVDRDRVDGWFSNDPMDVVARYGGEWRTTTFAMGDVMVFGMFTMHGALTNQSDRFRLSCDTRFQLASEPVDERWIGENPMGHYAWQSEPDKLVSMAEARARWGV